MAVRMRRARNLATGTLDRLVTATPPTEPPHDDPLGGLIVELLAEDTTVGLATRLAATACAQADLERAVIFVWDSALRRARPVGAYAIDTATFSDFYAAPEGVAFVRRAFDRDEVVDVVGAQVEGEIPPWLRDVAAGRRVICVPMTALGQRVGLILADRDAARPPLTPAERERLLTLGKAVAVAIVAGDTTRRSERARQLRHQVDLAREVHDGVVQRLFGVSLALAGDGPLDAHARARCLTEIEAVMHELRDAVARPAAGRGLEPARPVDLEAELAKWGVAHPELAVITELHAPHVVPAGSLVHTMLLESLRNLRRHAEPTSVRVRSTADGETLRVEVINDGVPAPAAGQAPSTPGVGLRLLSIEALHAGGLVDYGPVEPGSWRVRLTLPDGAVAA
jgi:signal transduction histidine kinase